MKWNEEDKCLLQAQALSMWSEGCRPDTHCELMLWQCGSPKVSRSHGLGTRAQTTSCSLGCCCSSSCHCHSAFQPGLQPLQASQAPSLFWQTHLCWSVSINFASCESISMTRLWRPSYVRTLDWLQKTVVLVSERSHRVMTELNMMNGMFIINRLNIYHYQQKGILQLNRKILWFPGFLCSFAWHSLLTLGEVHWLYWSCLGLTSNKIICLISY